MSFNPRYAILTLSQTLLAIAVVVACQSSGLAQAQEEQLLSSTSDPYYVPASSAVEGQLERLQSQMQAMQQEVNQLRGNSQYDTSLMQQPATAPARPAATV